MLLQKRTSFFGCGSWSVFRSWVDTEGRIIDPTVQKLEKKQSTTKKMQKQIKKTFFSKIPIEKLTVFYEEFGSEGPGSQNPIKTIKKLIF